MGFFTESFSPTDIVDTTVDTNTGAVKRSKRLGVSSAINV